MSKKANVSSLQETNRGQLFVTVPRALAQSKKWGKGSKLEFIDNGIGSLVLKGVE